MLNFVCIGMAFLRWYLVIPHVQTVQNMYGKGGYRVCIRVSQKKQSSFLWPGDLNLAVSICKETIYLKSDFYLKNWPAIFRDLGCKKKGLRKPESKNEDHFLSSTGQTLKIAYFRLIFGRFPLIKSQNQNPMLLSVNFWDKTLIFGIWFPYI